MPTEHVGGFRCILTYSKKLSEPFHAQTQIDDRPLSRKTFQRRFFLTIRIGILIYIKQVLFKN